MNSNSNSKVEPLIQPKNLVMCTTECDFCKDKSNIYEGAQDVYVNREKLFGYIICGKMICALRANNAVQRYWDENGGKVINYLKNYSFRIYRTNNIIEDNWIFDPDNLEIITLQDRKDREDREDREDRKPYKPIR